MSITNIFIKTFLNTEEQIYRLRYLKNNIELTLKEGTT